MTNTPRQIKFRFVYKHVSGSIRIDDGYDIISIINRAHESSMYFSNAEYEFIGLDQCTDKKDCHKNHIHDGDILKEDFSINYAGDKKGCLRLVEWNKGHMRHTALSAEQLESEKKGYNTFKYAYDDNCKEYHFLSSFESYEVEIIGTIHENPELLDNKG